MSSRTFHRPAIAAALTLALGCGQAGVIDPGVTGDTGPAGTVCAPGHQLCSGQNLLLCRQDGTGFTDVPCALGCQNGACLTAACPPNSQRCAGPKLAQVCDAAGQLHQTVCDFGCLNGECSGIVCTAGLTFCEPDGTKVQRCSLDGLSLEEVEVCPHGCDPATATCHEPACAVGQLACGTSQPLQVRKCNADRTGFEPTGVVCTEKCVAGHCEVKACAPGQQRCGGDGVERCNTDGSAFVLVEPCQWGCLSNSAGEALCALCLPDATACKGNDIVVCEAPYLPWTTVKTCAEIDSCAGGECVMVLALTGSASGTDTLLLLIEALADCWLTMKAAQEKTAICRAIDTTGLNGDISKIAMDSWFCDNVGDTIVAQDFSDIEHFEAAQDVFGCGLLDYGDLTIDTPGQAVHAGLPAVECIAHEKNEVIVAPCDVLKAVK